MAKLIPLQSSTESVPKTGFYKNAQNKKYRFRLTDSQNNYYIGRKPVVNSKCNFEIHNAGLMLSGDFCENYQQISILAKELVSITLIRGTETFDTFYMSPIHLLRKMGVPSKVSRHFRFHPTEYKINETKIIIEAKEQRLELITNGYRFEKLRRDFKKMGYRNILNIKRNPTLDLSDFKTTIPDREPRFLK